MLNYTTFVRPMTLSEKPKWCPHGNMPCAECEHCEGMWGLFRNVTMHIECNYITSTAPLMLHNDELDLTWEIRLRSNQTIQVLFSPKSQWDWTTKHKDADKVKILEDLKTQIPGVLKSSYPFLALKEINVGGDRPDEYFSLIGTVEMNQAETPV